MLVVMTRAQRPLRPAAGTVIPLTLQTYVTVRHYYMYYVYEILINIYCIILDCIILEIIDKYYFQSLHTPPLSQKTF